MKPRDSHLATAPWMSPTEGESAARTRSRARDSVASRREYLEKAPDGELARLCARGDERAWETLVRRYRRLVYAIPYRAGLPSDQVEEIFHETYAKLAEGIGRIRDPERVRAWVVTTARRLTIDRIRSRQRSPTIEDSEEAFDRVENPEESASDRLERLEDRHMLRQALLRIDPRCRRLLTALFYGTEGEPPSYEKISEELEIPVGSIGPTRARCLKKLRERFEEIENE